MYINGRPALHNGPHNCRSTLFCIAAEFLPCNSYEIRHYGRCARHFRRRRAGCYHVFRFSVKWRGSVPPLVSVPPLRGGDFQGIGSTDPMCFGEERERQASAPNIVSMSPPSYPSAWLHPCRARFRFAWQSHCSSPAHATFCRRFWRCWRASSSLRSRAAWISA